MRIRTKKIETNVKPFTHKVSTSHGGYNNNLRIMQRDSNEILRKVGKTKRRKHSEDIGVLDCDSYSNLQLRKKIKCNNGQEMPIHPSRRKGKLYTLRNVYNTSRLKPEQPSYLFII